MRLSIVHLLLPVLIFGIVTVAGGRTEEPRDLPVMSKSGDAPPEPVPFRVGEKLVFSVEYGFITAGEATMEVAGIDTIDGFPSYHLRTIAKTNEIFSSFYKVDDRIESHLDIERKVSRHFEKHLREGSYSRDFEVRFDHDNLRAYSTEGDTLEMLPETQDVLSAFFFLRTLDLRVGKTLSFPCHDNEKNYPLEVKVLRKEKVVVPAGKFVCYVVEPKLKSGGLTRKGARMLIWVTADERKMPVLMETKIKVGAIAAKLKDYVPGDDVDGAERP
jgi:hypothetical protein